METKLDLSVEIKTKWIEKFIRFIESDGCSELTRKAYRQDINHFANWFEQQNGQEFTPDLITSIDLRAYREAHLKINAAPASFNRRRATLKRLCSWSIDHGYLSYDPFQGVDPLDQIEPPPRWLSNNEYHRFIRQMELAVNGAQTDHWRWQAVRDQAIVALMLYAGLREFEICALNVEDIQIGERKGRVIIWQGKGKKKREVPLSIETRRALLLWIEVAQRDKGTLFLGKGGNRISTRLVQKRVEAIRRAADLDSDVTPHALRHTFAKRLLDAGNPLTVVSKLLGHSRLDTTARYVQPGWSDFENAVERI